MTFPMWLKEEGWRDNGPHVRTRDADWCSRISTLFIFFVHHLMLIAVQPTPHLWFMEHRRLIKDLHVTSAFIILLPKGLIVQSFCFKLVYGTHAGVAHYGF